MVAHKVKVNDKVWMHKNISYTFGDRRWWIGTIVALGKNSQTYIVQLDILGVTYEVLAADLKPAYITADHLFNGEIKC